MFSFAEENRGSLVDFFSEAVQSRKKSILHPEGSKLFAWVADQEEQKRLRALCPAINDVQPCAGIHAEAYLLDDCVVKTNVFDEFYRDGQMSWLKWCIQHQDNPLVPRMSFLMVDEATERFLTVMERLVPHAGFENHSFREDIDCALKAAFERVGAGPAFRRELARFEREALLAIQELMMDLVHLDPEEDAELIEVLNGHIAEHRQTVRYVNELSQFQFKLGRQHRRYFKQIQNKFHAARSIGQIIDVHAFNWMLRPNSEHVILDPIN